MYCTYCIQFIRPLIVLAVAGRPRSVFVPSAPYHACWLRCERRRHSHMEIALAGTCMLGFWPQPWRCKAFAAMPSFHMEPWIARVWTHTRWWVKERTAPNAPGRNEELSAIHENTGPKVAVVMIVPRLWNAKAPRRQRGATTCGAMWRLGIVSNPTCAAPFSPTRGSEMQRFWLKRA